MKYAATLQYEIQPRPDQTSWECLSAVRSEVVAWVVQVASQFGLQNLAFPFDGSCSAPGKGHEIRTDDQECGPYRLATLEWEVPADPPRPAIYVFSAVMAADARTVQVALTLGTCWRSAILRNISAKLTFGNPLGSLAVLALKLRSTWNCLIEGQPLPTRLKRLRSNQVETFVRNTLATSERIFPCIVFLPGSLVSLDQKALEEMQYQVGGIAQVVSLADVSAVDRMARVLGAGFQKDKAALIYWPVANGPLDFMAMPADWIQTVMKSRPLAKVLQELILESTSVFREGRLIRAVRAALAADRAARARNASTADARVAAAEAELQRLQQAHQALQQQADSAKRHVAALLDELTERREELKSLRAAAAVPPSKQDEELAAELERAWDENKDLQKELETARRQVSELETDFRNYVESTAIAWEGSDKEVMTPVTTTGGPRFTTVADALHAAASEFSDLLTVWEDAEQSAQQSPFANPAKVFQALQGIAEVGRDYFKQRNGGPKLGPMDLAFRRIPFKYSCFESPTTLALFGAKRVFHHKGQSRQMQRHLTLGGGSTNGCLQIYFEFDDTTQRVLIGYCGKHLPYSGQRT